jgi:hypothetical protein
MRNQIIQTIGRTLRVADVILSKRAITIALIASALMTGCMYLPRYVEGIPTTEPWSALPLRGWMTNDGIRAEAITACFAADCPQKIAVASLIAEGKSAVELARLLTNPAPLVKAISTGRTLPRRPAPKPLLATHELIRLGAFSGFLITIRTRDGKARAAYAMALGSPMGQELHILMLVGQDRDALLHSAQQATAAN